MSAVYDPSILFCPGSGMISSPSSKVSTPELMPKPALNDYCRPNRRRPHDVVVVEHDYQSLVLSTTRSRMFSWTNLSACSNRTRLSVNSINYIESTTNWKYYKVKLLQIGITTNWNYYKLELLQIGIGLGVLRALPSLGSDEPAAYQPLSAEVAPPTDRSNSLLPLSA